MGKRGEITLKGLVELFVAAAILVAVTYIAYQTGTQEHYIKLKITKDVAAAASTFSAVEGNGWLHYNINPAETLILTSSKAEIPHDKFPTEKYFAAEGIIERRVDAQKLYLFKDGANLTISDSFPRLTQFDCAPYTLDVDNLIIKGTEEIKLVGHFFFDGVCNEKNVCAIDNAAFSRSADFVVKTLPMKMAGIAIRYPPDSQESKKVACALANQLRLPDVWLLPTSDAEIRPRGLLIEMNGVDQERLALSLQEVLR